MDDLILELFEVAFVSFSIGLSFDYLILNIIVDLLTQFPASLESIIIAVNQFLPFTNRVCSLYFREQDSTEYFLIGVTIVSTKGYYFLVISRWSFSYLLHIWLCCLHSHSAMSHSDSTVLTCLWSDVRFGLCRLKCFEVNLP